MQCNKRRVLTLIWVVFQVLVDGLIHDVNGHISMLVGVDEGWSESHAVLATTMISKTYTRLGRQLTEIKRK